MTANVIFKTKGKDFNYVYRKRYNDKYYENRTCAKSYWKLRKKIKWNGDKIFGQSLL